MSDSSRPGGLVDDDGAVADAFAKAVGGGRKRRRRDDRSAETEEVTTTSTLEAPSPAVAQTASEQAADAPYFAPLTEQPQQGADALAPRAGAEDAATGPVVVPEPREQQGEPAAGTEVAVRQSTPSPDVSPRMVARPVVRRSAVSGKERTTQVTIHVSTGVRDRFEAYQLLKKLEGAEPTNAVVVRRAVLHAHRAGAWQQMREYVRHRQMPVFEEDDDPDGLFGDAPASRQAVRGRSRDSVQQTFRPTLAELARYDELADAHGFDNRSEFLDAALELFLPPLEKRRR